MLKPLKRFGQKKLSNVPLVGGVSQFHQQQVHPLWEKLSRSIPKLRLSHQLIGFFVIVVFFPLLLLSLSIYSINQKAVKKQVSSFTEHTAEVTYEDLRLEMRWQQEQALLAAHYWKTLLEDTAYSTRQRAITEFFRNFPDYEAVAFYDGAGQFVNAYRANTRDAREAFVPEKIQSMPSQITFKLGHHIDKSNPRVYSLQVLLPPSATASRRAGAVYFFKRFPYMNSLVKERFQTFGNGFAIVDETGSIIAGPPHLIAQKLPKEDLQLFQNLKAGIAKEFSSSKPLYGILTDPDDLPDNPKLQKVIMKVPTLGWGVMIESPYRVQRQYILRARTQSVGLLILCILLIIVLGLFYSRGINRNFRQLIKGIKALAEGHYSRKIRLITKSWTPYEIIYLTAEFNRMATKISSAWSSIQQLNQELVYKNQQDLFITRATQRLHSSLELDTVCQVATEILSEHPKVIGTMLFLQTEAGTLELVSKTLPHLFVNLEDAVIENLRRSIEKHPTDHHHTLRLSEFKMPFTQQAIVANLQSVSYQETLLGTLVLLMPEDSISSPSEAMVFDLISSQIGVAIQQARQWKQLQIANTQLAKLDEMKSNLIDTVSHELRTPLTNIKGYTSRLIRNDSSLDAETKIKSLKIIKQQADRLGRMVEDLLVIPELERGEGLRVYPDRVNLHELLSRCVGFIGEKAGSRPIRVLDCPAEMDILADPDRMEQVILNLLDNANKYASEDGVIEVRAAQYSGTHAEIQVFNPCDPITDEEISSLFAKFRRLDERLTRTTRGTGLGLFITKGLIESMSGSIRLDNRDGFRAIIQIPLFEAQGNASDGQHQFELHQTLI